eukprot:5368593-Pyramimonas_sp.AAC.1
MAVKKRPSSRTPASDDDSEPLLRRRPAAAPPAEAAAARSSAASSMPSTAAAAAHDVQSLAAPPGVPVEFIARVTSAAARGDQVEHPSAYMTSSIGIGIGLELSGHDHVQRTRDTLEYFSGWGTHAYWARQAGLSYDAYACNDMGDFATAPSIAYA